jgi:hypothetical protein
VLQQLNIGYGFLNVHAVTLSLIGAGRESPSAHRPPIFRTLDTGGMRVFSAAPFALSSGGSSGRDELKLVAAAESPESGIRRGSLSCPVSRCS